MNLVYYSFSSKEQVSFNFMAAFTICSGFGAQENKVCHCFQFLSICHEVMGLDAMIFIFGMLSLSQLFHSPLSRSSRGSLVRFRIPAIRPVSSACLRFLILLVSIWPSSESLGMAEFHYGHSIRCALIQLHLVHTAGLLTKCKS